MNNRKTLTTGIIVLILIIAGAGVFWLFSGDPAEYQARQAVIIFVEGSVLVKKG